MTTEQLLTAGAVAGPGFVLVVTAEALMRDGFDLAHHPISLLSLGEHGWIQIAAFVVTGLLVLAFAAGLRQALVAGTGRTWVPRLMTVNGLGLLAGGVFVADPALGFPPGTPDEVPDDLSWHALLHAVAPPVAFTALVLAALVVARRFQLERRAGWAAYSALTGVAALLLVVWPDPDSISWRLYVAIVVGYAWTTAYALRVRLTLPAAAAAAAGARAPSGG
jgi:hypothetical membrane protein